MRWSNEFEPSESVLSYRRLSLLSVFAAVILLSIFLLSAAPSAEKRVSIYSAAANYTLPVLQRNGQDYVGLFEILEPLGTVVANGQGSRWKLRYNDADSEFTDGKTRGRIRGHDYDLPAKFILENGRGLVPLNSLSTLMPRYLGGPVTFHENSHRLFIGSVAVHFTAQVNKNNPPSLVMDFTSPVNPMIATEPGKMLLVFNHEPLVPPGSQVLTFDSKTIPTASYQEDNGAAQIAVTGTVPLFATFSNDGRTITIAPAPQPVAQATTPPPTPPPTLSIPSSGNSIPMPSGAVAYFAVVDASHGGEERGAALSDQLAEKDMTLSFARRLRQELEAHGVTTLLLREGDTTLSLDQRASMANSSRSRIYIGVHATSQGHGVHLYSGLLPASGENRGPFLDWQTAQASSLAMSQTAAASINSELLKVQVPVRTLMAPLRPLNNITIAAVAVEIGPPSTGVADLNSAGYQQLVANAVAAGVYAVRSRLEASR